jgi:MYXO-CTERM domain-containing protein
VVNSAYRHHTDAVGATPASDYWQSGSGLDPYAVAQTAWVLTSLAFASTATESTEKLLAQQDPLDNEVRGLVTLHTTGGVTISAAERGMVNAATLGANVVLPIGSLNFTLNNVTVGGTALLTITPPAGALDPTNPKAFVQADGTTLKAGLNWFKITGGAWKGQAGVPITVDLAKGVIAVTLKDGGPEDADGVANGKIVDPGAPGYGVEPVADVPVTPVTPAAPVAAAPADDSGGCTVGTGPADPTLLALLAGSMLWLRRRRNANKAK